MAGVLSPTVNIIAAHWNNRPEKSPAGKRDMITTMSAEERAICAGTPPKRRRLPG